MYCFYSHKNSYLNYEKQNQTHFHQGQYFWIHSLGKLLGCYRKADIAVPGHGALGNSIRHGLGSYLENRVVVHFVFPIQVHLDLFEEWAQGSAAEVGMGIV